VLTPGYNQDGLRIDSLGFRGPEVTQQKAAGTYRIVALGDSMTFGPHESECAYPYQLPGLLAPASVESINAGVEGYKSEHALLHLQQDVRPLHPDLITVFIGWNDLYETNPVDEQDQQSLEASPLSRIFLVSDAAQTFRRLYFGAFRTRSANTDPTAVSVGMAALQGYQPRAYANNLRQIFQTAKASGADVVTFTWPILLSDQMSDAAKAKAHYPWYTNQANELLAVYHDYQDTLRKVAAQEQVPVIDNAAIFEGHGDKAPLFTDSVHVTCDGQTMIAQNVAQQLEAGIVPSFPPHS
jgi:lysophospholipase L1-like esterase